MKVAALAGVFRTWGIRTYLSANCAAPIHPSATPDRMKRWGGIGNLETADPLDPAVREWWKKKFARVWRDECLRYFSKFAKPGDGG